MIESYWDKNLFDVEMSDLIGRTFTKVTKTDDELRLEDAEGVFRFYHSQDCCESVYIESVVGDLDDLVGEPIVRAEEAVGDEHASPDWTPGEYDESHTWTFYKLATRKGYVDIRWFGSSNGYYSESVSVEFKKK